jgi:hypothetical protein
VTARPSRWLRRETSVMGRRKTCVMTCVTLLTAVVSFTRDPRRSGSFVLLGRSQSQSLCPFHQRARSEAPWLHRRYPVSTLPRASPPTTRPGLALAGCPLRLPPLSSSVSRASWAFLQYMPSSLPRRNCKVHLSLTSLATLAFPTYPLGRLPHQLFRGLLERSLALRPAFSRDHQVILHSQAGLPPAKTRTHSRRTDKSNTCRIRECDRATTHDNWVAVGTPVARRPRKDPYVRNYLIRLLPRVMTISHDSFSYAPRSDAA